MEEASELPARFEYASAVGVHAGAIYDGGVLLWSNIFDELNRLGADGYRVVQMMERSQPESSNDLPVFTFLMERSTL